MPKYRKKPVVVEAEQWWPKSKNEYVCFPPADKTSALARELCRECGVARNQHGKVYTLEGWLMICPGDWIITGVKGKRYLCKADIFAQTYEPADVADMDTEAAAIGESISLSRCACPNCGQPHDPKRVYGGPAMSFDAGTAEGHGKEASDGSTGRG